MEEKKQGKLLIFSAPSGSGKSTLVNHLLENIPDMAFSISATTREPRGEEVNGREYYFISLEEFKQRVDNGEFLEWQEVYPGRCYGTLLSVVKNMQKEGKHVVFDVDVVGGTNIKKFFGNEALSVFIQAPSVEVLRERLIGRNTDSMEEIEKRLAKAAWEMDFAQGKFDVTIINDDLQTAKDKILKVVNEFLERKNTQVILPETQVVESMIHSIRGLQVMLDFDLARFYGIETKRLKEQVRRNRNRFPSDIMFELTDEEFECLRSHFATSNKRGGTRYHPYAFTETGVAMLSSVLNSEQAIQINLQIMRAFVSMRRFVNANAKVFQRIEALEFKQIENGKKIDEILSKLDSGELKPKLGVFFEGQMFDAFLLVETLIKKATKRLVLVDDYVDAAVLDRFSLRNKNVSVDIYVHSQRQNLAMLRAFETYNIQHSGSQLTLHAFNESHDRWLVVDDEIYHFGASIKDLGKKWFGVNIITEMTADDFIAKL